MEQLATGIAANVYLQAISIVVTLATAFWFVWNARKAVTAVIGAILGFFAQKIWIPVETSLLHIRLGARSPSFLVAVLFRRSVTVILCIFGWYFCRTIQADLRPLLDDSVISRLLQASLMVLNNVFMLVGGARLGEITLISRHVMRLLEKEDQ